MIEHVGRLFVHARRRTPRGRRAPPPRPPPSPSRRCAGDRRAARPCMSPRGARARARSAFARASGASRRSARVQLAPVKAASARRCDRPVRPAPPARAACRRRSPGAARAPSARFRSFRPCATARRASGSTGAARRLARARAAPARSCRRASAPRRCSSPGPRTAPGPARRRQPARRSARPWSAHSPDCRSRPVDPRFQTDCSRTMASMLERKLLVVTGKGGVGKTTVAGALGLLASERGCARSWSRWETRLGCPSCSGSPAASRASRRAPEGLWSISIDPDRALLEWLQTLGGRVSAACSPPAAPSSTSPRRRPARRSS